MRYILTTLLIISTFISYSQPDEIEDLIGTKSLLPDVFLIGEYEYAYEQLVQNSDIMLLNVCNNSMDDAFSRWNKFLFEMESYAEELNFNIKGVKIWINVFWKADGSIRHIVYYPKPNSININYKELTSFFKNFIKVYNIPIQYESEFSHYGIASFSTFAKITERQEK